MKHFSIPDQQAVSKVLYDTFSRMFPREAERINARSVRFQDIQIGDLMIGKYDICDWLDYMMAVKIELKHLFFRDVSPDREVEALGYNAAIKQNFGQFANAVWSLYNPVH